MKSIAVVAISIVTSLVSLPVISQSSAPQNAPTTSQMAPEHIAKDLGQKVSAWTRGQFKVVAVRTTPVPELFEIQIRNDLYFVDKSGRYIIVDGEMIDMNTDRNITRDRMAQVLRIDFTKLPLDKAIKQVNGDGSRAVALFEDPNCAYCRRLRADLMKVENLTVYTFAYPILAADSDSKSRKALCAADPGLAWNDLLLNGKVPNNDGSCTNALDEFVALGQQYGISATPTMFFPNGHRVQGYAPPARFEKLLQGNQKAKQ